MMTSIPLPLFVTLWNRGQGRATPDVHLRMATWLAARFADGDDRLLLMAFRGAGKSTLVGLMIAWALMENPNLRVLVVAADENLATRMVRNVRRVIEKHPLTRALVPKGPGEWAADRITVNRTADWRDPSVMACGLNGNYTGMRADLIICDDVEVPETSNTGYKREELRTRLKELAYVQAGRARMIYVGTPHTVDTIYATAARSDASVAPPFLAGYQALRIPVLDRNGDSVWPEKYSLDELDKLEKQTGASHFQSQMMLEPTAPSPLYLNAADIQIYQDDVILAKEISTLWLGERKIVSASAWWDPALASGKGDASVVATAYTDERGHIFVHHVVYLQGRCGSDEAEAEVQCRQVVAVLRASHVSMIGVEINGIGRLLPGLLRKAIVRERIPCALVEVSSREPKHERIRQALEARLAARMLSMHRSVLETPFFDELRDYRPDRPHNRDDGIDAVAGAILMEPMRLAGTNSVGITRPAWRSGQMYQAKT